MANRIDASTMMGAGSTLTMGGSTFAVGYQGGALKSPSAVTGNGISFNGSTLTIKSPGAVIDSVDLRNVNVEVRANNVTIKNSLFNATGFHTIYQTGGATGLIVEYNTFDGQKANNSHSDYHLQRQRPRDDPQQRVLQPAFRRRQHRRRPHREELLLRRGLPDRRPCGRDLDPPHLVAGDDPPELHRLRHAAGRRDSRHERGHQDRAGVRRRQRRHGRRQRAARRRLHDLRLQRDLCRLEHLDHQQRHRSRQMGRPLSRLEAEQLLLYKTRDFTGSYDQPSADRAAGNCRPPRLHRPRRARGSVRRLPGRSGWRRAEHSRHLGPGLHEWRRRQRRHLSAAAGSTSSGQAQATTSSSAAPTATG